MDDTEFDRALVGAVFQLAGDRGWRRASVADAARQSGLPLDRARARFSVKSMVLLRFSSIAALGLLLALIGVAAYSIYAWAYLEVVPGWTSIMIAIIVVSFFQLIALSVISEYVGRIYISTKHRPLFIVDAIERRAIG